MPDPNAVPADSRTGATPDPYADTLLIGGNIRTPTGPAQALAVRDGIIDAVGTDADVLRRRGPRTRVFELAGATVLPGLHDLHVHPIYAGVRERRCKVPQGSDLPTTLRIVAEHVARAAPGAWVLGGQWDAYALGATPDRTQLDAIAPDHPVLLEDTSGHSSWANSAALRAAGIGPGTPDPVGGIFERDADGRPTGVQRETAAEFLAGHAPRASDEEVEEALEWALGEMLSYGITSFTEAAVGFTAGAPSELRAYTRLAARDAVKQRARLCLVWSPHDPTCEEVIARRNHYASRRLTPDCVKVFLDGVPTDSHTAAMLAPYQDTVAGRDPEFSRYGILAIAPPVLNHLVTRLDREGITVKFHAAGDAAVRAALDAIETAREANGPSPHMHNVGHCTFVAPSDLARAARIGATFEVSPYLWRPSPICSDITAAVGAKAVERAWPVRDLLDSGALVVAGSDWCVVPSVNPWAAIESLVTRQEPGGSADSFGAAQAVTREEAFDLFTVNAARQEGMAHRVGRIEPGMLADVIAVDRDPFEIPVTEVHATRVQLTFVGGELVYRA
ncbi:amidohydrolase [Streptomyces spiroverticillatus]|uniref:Amidohydrolase n=1 Tax=Streptomyces finlayi TaxID=67296 RepID=A0A919C961_9ACTN|nr:amidohydrolase [Streptomyces finlayi]GHA06174.1 amidohydrolase [Streptomyces spiroverticillatus]GHC89812.1 amidohydrolase [Streptomyces finlayi]